MADLPDIVARLQGISEELADAGMDALREAIASGATKRPERERKLAQARRAVERAIAVLQDEAAGVAGPDDDP